MKDLMKKMKSFITFDFPLQPAYISAQFVEEHRKIQVASPGWSTTATRQKLIAKYCRQIIQVDETNNRKKLIDTSNAIREHLSQINESLNSWKRPLGQSPAT